MHQVLSYERLHPEQMTNTSRSLEAYFTSKLGDLRAYGPLYLEPAEQEKRINELMEKYYKRLAFHAVHFRVGGFWSFQRKRLKEVGFPFSSASFAKAISAKVLDLLLNPKETSGKLLKRLAPN